MTKQISLLVNNLPVSVDYFVQGFIDHTVSGMIMGLEGTPKTRDQIDKLDLSVDGPAVKLIVNSKNIPANAFVIKIIRNTLVGLVSSLKEVTKPEKIEIHIVS